MKKKLEEWCQGGTLMNQPPVKIILDDLRKRLRRPGEDLKQLPFENVTMG